MSQYEREPTGDERAGLNWWNTRTPEVRARMLRSLTERGIPETPANCWRVFGGKHRDNARPVHTAERVRQ